MNKSSFNCPYLVASSPHWSWLGNNIPNYDYVGGFIRGLRFSPIGNFVSFPAEIIRTGINTAKQGFKELQDDNLRSVGFKRLAGLGLFGFAMGEGAVLAGQLAYGVSNKTLNSLKEYLLDRSWLGNQKVLVQLIF